LSAVFVESTALSARHGFFTRLGGVSTGAYATLNCSLSGGDTPDAVHENRRRVAAALHATRLVGLTQIHGTTVATVDHPWPDGSGPRADAMVTNRSGLALGIITADCTPILLHDPAAGIIAAAHAGWRGAVAGVLEETIAAMQQLGATIPAIHAAIGPCISQPSYEVSADLRDAVLAHNPADSRFFQDGRPNHWQFNLPAYCAARLQSLGLATIEILGLDTRNDPDRFFSHRRRTLAGGGPIGHQISAIVL
jgi:polyphenol oxidase